MSDQSVGLLLRVFSSNPQNVSGTVDKVMRTLALADDLTINHRNVFSRIDVLVSSDKTYGDTDCGLTADRIRERLVMPASDSTDFPVGRGVPARVHEPAGDIFCGLLNYGVAYQLSQGVTHSMVLSVEARQYLTEDNMKLMLTALTYGGKVTGLAITELEQSILEGRIANTCAIWENLSLMTVGAFDLMARKAKVNGELRPNAGVEEIPPLLRLIELFGRCIAPIKPRVGATWEPPTDSDALVRHEAKMASKLSRQQAHAAALGYSDVTKALKAGVMDDF